MKILYFDVETTGLDLKVHHIFQLSGVIDIDGNVVEEFNFMIRPPSGSLVSKDALKVTGKTIDDLRGYPESNDVYRQFTRLLAKYVNKFDKNDKFYPAAYNGHFDLDFVNKFFLDNEDVYFGSWQNWQLIDPLPLLRWYGAMGAFKVADHKLKTICDYFGITINAHDAMSDIKATRELILKLSQFLGKHTEIFNRETVLVGKEDPGF